MTWYLVLLRGIHDVPGNRRHGETVVADIAADALEYAIGRFGLSAVPEGSTAVALQQVAA
jgi:hypothetical protein